MGTHKFKLCNKNKYYQSQATYCICSTSHILTKQMVPCIVGLRFLLYWASTALSMTMHIHLLTLNHQYHQTLNQIADVLQFTKVFSIKLPTVLICKTFLPPMFLLYGTTAWCKTIKNFIHTITNVTLCCSLQHCQIHYNTSQWKILKTTNFILCRNLTSSQGIQQGMGYQIRCNNCYINGI